MARDETLRRVEREIAAGQLGKARDRLQGLLLSYPDDLYLRQRLGDVFWLLQYPEKAGQYWYLLPSGSSEMERAKQAFEARFHSSPALMLYELRYRGGLESVRDTHAEEMLLGLAASAGLSNEELERVVAARDCRRPRPNLRDGAEAVGCGGVAVLALLLFVLGVVNGLVAVIRWLF